MRGIYIKGMKMPYRCCECKLKYWDGEEDVCPFVGVIASIGRHDDCPLVPVPDHGRLIDADALENVISQNIYDYWNGGEGGYYLAEDAIGDVRIAPTIIPASKEDE